MHRNVKIAVGVVAGLLVIGRLVPDGSPTRQPTFVAQQEQPVPPATDPPATEAPVPEAAETAEPIGEAALLQAAGGGDGDSWKDTGGREYRLGLVNAPETDECFGTTATAKRKELVADGFGADVYATDTSGRSVAVVTLADGRNLNVWLARNGFVDDRYLARFRYQNPRLATELDGAFAAAKTEKVGFWGACAAQAPASTPQAPKPRATQPLVAESRGDGCHPSYETCIPVKGDGSGRGSANDLDCGDLRKLVVLRDGGGDPYRLDDDGDGKGCESYA